MNSIEKQYLDFLKNKCISSESKFLIGVSGGMDSMVCLEIARKFSKDISVAHVNYKLRGEESDRDEKIVEDYCKKWGLSFHLLISNINKAKNIQLEARNSRYSFFNEILVSNKLDYIITAHHLNDNVETFLLNTFRGSGINGLTGIPHVRKQIIRPLITISKKEIIDYCTQKNIAFGEDSSNNISNYKRNFLRNDILPLLSKQFPDFFEKTNKTILNLQSDKKLLQLLIEKELNGTVTKNNDGYIIKKNNEVSIHAWYHFFKDFGFNYNQVLKWVKNDQQSGKSIFSEKHELINNREEWLLYPIVESKNIKIKIGLNESITKPIKISCVSTVPPKSFSTDRNECFLDLEKLQFPLTINKWERGDHLQPIGMKGSKKISDILIDKKISIHDKRNVLVLKSNNTIVWLIGHIINDNYKVTTKTSRCYKIKFH
jgi:tRNA(Ile)-lysidine synthase